ncbi:MAG: hypothetical protein ACPGRZ_07805 [Alphaproteobacteria bacterium]
MNIPAFHAAARAVGNAAAQTPEPAQTRQQPAATTPSPTLPREAVERPPEARPVIEASEPALTRRDLPRGSVIDIIA